MPSVNKSALVPFSARAMYDLVNDVESYPQFLPGCVETKLLESSDSHMRASLLVSKAGVKQWFSTKNTLVPAKRVDMELDDGPFKYLRGGWVFTELSDDACKIEFKLDFEFKNKLVALAFGKVFSALTASLVNAFIDRAKQIY